jgi:UDP-glucose 4-epimerase
LCLGRQRFDQGSARRNFGLRVTYLILAMDDILSLGQRLEDLDWKVGDDCVFFNFAWGGDQNLTDGGFSIQLKNAIYAANAVRAAKNIGCIKFVNAGTLEETYVENYLNVKDSKVYQSSQTDYALAKLASRDLCKMVAYMENINYIHTRLSVPLAFDLSQGSYVAKTLKQIAGGLPYSRPVNKNLYDVISIDDVARAYKIIGENGKNKADYFIGTSRPATLADYFDCFSQLVNSEGKCTLKSYDAGEAGLFSTEALCRDTGFVPIRRFVDIMKHLKTL